MAIRKAVYRLLTRLAIFQLSKMLVIWELSLDSSHFVSSYFLGFYSSCKFSFHSLSVSCASQLVLWTVYIAFVTAAFFTPDIFRGASSICHIHLVDCINLNQISSTPVSFLMTLWLNIPL